MKETNERTIVFDKEEILEKLGITGNVSFMSFDYKTGKLTIKGEINTEKDDGWFSFG
jgi:hypothetical protein